MFEGFSEEEIRRISHSIPDYNTTTVPKTNNNRKQGSFGSIGRNLVRSKRRSELQKKLSTRESNLPTPKEEDEEEEKEIELNNKKENLKNEAKEVKFEEVPTILTSNALLPLTLTKRIDTNAIKDVSVDFQDTPSIKALNEFEETRKKLEALNLEKKEKLKQALSDRAKKTHEEVAKLNQIEEELKKLDTCLSNDVFILRNEIESASHEFMEAQKRFNKAEKEYVEAKMELFTKKERKELLTSHLCSIIEQNELRKAKKLSDLMEKLEVPSKPMQTVSFF
ncbi:hypothetical protein O3M35_002865 [Rhynocoris fuscipes]|uniref:RAB6-interacting golgin n=1 Tax=Rhynocoris fuscipes TaxID=488301 RepID=A0AAW1CUK2_9HEMI